MILISKHIIQSILSIIKIFILSKFFRVLQTKTSVKKSCVIIANGPSLTTSLVKYANQLNDHDTVCVNYFAMSEYYCIIKPKFYILAAPLFFFADNKLSRAYIDSRNQIFSNIQEKTNWNLTLMVPFIAKKSKFFTAFLHTNPKINCVYFNPTPIEGLSYVNNILFNLGLGMPRPHNILIPAIMNCIYLNYKVIYIIGADHSWLPEISVNEKNEALINQKHFYDEADSKPEQMNDLISRPRKLHEIIHKFYLTFKGYWLIKEYASSKNVRIYNASEISTIDAFERKKISE
jgi:hypothetical protein